MTADTAVVVENAEKWFGLNPALQNLSLRIDRGEFVVLLGRNGAGKSTLLQVMARLVQPNRGQVRILRGGCSAGSRTREGNGSAWWPTRPFSIPA